MKTRYIIGIPSIITLTFFAIMFAGMYMQRESFSFRLQQEGFAIIDGSMDASAVAYTNHEGFIKFAQLNNVTTIYNRGAYYYAYNPQTETVYVTTANWANYKQ